MPSHLDTARKGLNARNVRKARNALISPYPAPSAPNIIREICKHQVYKLQQHTRMFTGERHLVSKVDSLLTATIMKSNQHQASVKYFLNPYAAHLNNISKMKTKVKILSRIWRVIFRFGFEFRLISSTAWNWQGSRNAYRQKKPREAGVYDLFLVSFFFLK